MDLTPYVDTLRRELAASAEGGDEDTRALAERLAAPLESATRLTLLRALSAAMGEVTRDLAPGSVDVRLRGLDPEFVVTPPPGPDEAGGADGGPLTAPPLAPPPNGEDGATARVNLRLPAHLKARVEQTAAREGLSVNAWLVRAATAALEPGAPGGPPGRARRWNGGAVTGWAS
ncbi:hypothetical protein GCM10009801_42950 [Streptomyces albiaxialis]|uniref:Histidine kinase n=1 Tax=Streptomyces albiaxialis TaxID=329523 RepID=A0ABP5HN61_9ACTN